MDQNGPVGHQDGAAASGGDGKKNLIPDLNMEEHNSAGGITKDKPRSEAEAEAEEEVVEVEASAADAGDDKGKSVAAAADDSKINANSIALERERRKRMKGLFSSLKELMPHVPQKSDKATIVGEAIHYIKLLEEKADMMEKKKLEQALARQAAARGEASSSLSATAMPQTAQGMAALCSSDAPRAGCGGVPAPPAAPAVAAPPVRIKTWSGQNMVLTVANDNAQISVCVPRRPNTLTMVMSVLQNHGIDVITAQISGDSVRVLFMIYCHVHRTNGATRSSEEVYQRAVSEIIYRLYSNNN